MDSKIRCAVCGIPVYAGELLSFEELELTACVRCCEDAEKLIRWIENEARAAVEQSPDYEELADGRWASVKPLESKR